MGLIGKEYLSASASRLVPHGGVLRHEGFPFLPSRLQQPLLGPLQDESQAVQVVQATAAAEADAEWLPHKLPHHLPVGQLANSMPAPWGKSCTAAFNSACCVSPRVGGTPVGSNSNALGPPSPKAATHRPVVCGSRSKASAVADPVQPWASSSRAYQRSRSRGLDPRIIRRRKALASISHCSKNPSMSLAPISNPSHTIPKLKPRWDLHL